MTGDPFAPFFDAQGFVVLDGGLATALEAQGQVLDSELWSARLLLDDPEVILCLHRAYLEAGADCITTAGYQASFEGLASAGLDRDEAEQALRRAVSLACEAKEAFWSDERNHAGRIEPIVAASAGPYGAFLADGSEYDGRYGVGRDVLERFHRARFDVLADTPADLVAFETIPAGLEVDAIAGLLAERTEAPAWISFTCRDEVSLRDGTAVVDAVAACAGLEALVAVGVNCTAPRHVAGLVERIASVTDLPVVVYPNSGEGYDPAGASWTGEPAEWIGHARAWVEAGARIVGGCCRVGPDEIARLRRSLVGVGPARPDRPA